MSVMLRFRDDRLLTSNGYDVSRLASYKSELRRLSERFYERRGGGGVRGGGRGAGVRRSFVVRDLRGGVWRVYRTNTR